MLVAMVKHINLIGSDDINISMASGKGDSDREVYCRLTNSVALPLGDKCTQCPYFAGFLQGRGVECHWVEPWDELEKPPEVIVRHDERQAEHMRVSQLIDANLLNEAEAEWVKKQSKNT